MAFVDFRRTENSKFVPNIISHAYYSRLSTALPVINSKKTPKSFTFKKLISQSHHRKLNPLRGAALCLRSTTFDRLNALAHGSGLWLVTACLDEILSASTDLGQTCQPTFTYSVPGLPMVRDQHLSWVWIQNQGRDAHQNKRLTVYKTISEWFIQSGCFCCRYMCSNTQSPEIYISRRSLNMTAWLQAALFQPCIAYLCWEN